ncbi:pseudouridine synthase [Vulgatibacter incomptus]|uniref:Ribosomal large subunit pseudouridine synthase B n=1 Tax=Vulgatibacter incomptus TaxID=1391653 RepID=A0A0K1PAL3_9BACT|nr:pseudouridine synthase [Vulgatibacter incomptus]AKU90542.1 Ribosomal large subunit pseudouridine synthase B [Vulgatibacter incomptus]
MAEERLQKILSRAGVASRRAAEELILDGRVQVNGETIRELGTRADPAKDVIRVDKAVIAEPDDLVHFVLYKPERVVTTLSDPEGRTSVGDLLRRAKARVYPVGRLDYDAEGTLLLTNDGELAHKLTHPRWGAKRTYLAKVKGEPAEAVLQQMRDGVRLEDGMARALEATFEKRTPRNTWIRLVLVEGRHHLVKRLCEAVGHPVVRLFRSDYAGVGVQGMQPGELRPLTTQELNGLRRAVAEEAPLPAGGRPRRRTARTQVAVRDPIYGVARPGASSPQPRRSTSRAAPAGPRGSFAPSGRAAPAGPRGSFAPSGRAAPAGPRGSFAPSGRPAPAGPRGSFAPSGRAAPAGPRGSFAPSGRAALVGPRGSFAPSGRAAPAGPRESAAPSSRGAPSGGRGFGATAKPTGFRAGPGRAPSASGRKPSAGKPSSSARGPRAPRGR